MPKVIVKKSDLPPVGKDGTYVIRCRIISDDKNSASYWTPIYRVMIPSEGSKLVKDAVMANVYHDPIGQSVPQNYNIYVSWHDPNDLGFYDIYTRWHTTAGWTDWAYQSTQVTRNFAFNPPLYLLGPGQTFDRYSVAVTRTNYQHQYSPELALFSTESMPDGGIPLV